MTTLEKFKKIVLRKNLIKPGARILIAVSGGLDSVSLLDFLYHIKDEYKLSLRIIHLNHGIRGAEADHDQQFVQHLAEQYKLPISVKKVSVPQFARQQKYSLEEAARILRYRFFKEELQKLNFDYVAMAHNANDQAETILDHFLRGSGLRGLQGMQSRRGQFIRPFLELTRKEIETYALEMGLNNVNDSTNRDLTYRRNKIRHQLIPFLEQEFNPALIKTLLRSGGIFKQLDIFLKNEAQKAYHSCLKSYKKNKIILDINRFFNYFSAVQVYVLFYILELLSLDERLLNFSQVEAYLRFIQNRHSGTKFPLQAGWEILIAHDELVFHQPKTKEFEFQIDIGKSYSLFDGEKILFTDIIERKHLPSSFPEKRELEFIDLEKVEGPLTIRNYRPGDRFIPLNMKGYKKVSDFFTDEKVPLHIRKQIPILTCNNGIIWILGYRIDDRFKVTSKSQTILRMEIKEEKDD